MLHFYGLGSEKEISHYKKSLDDVQCESPYYRYELLKSSEGDHQELAFFTYTNTKEDPLVVMPFVLRKILDVKGKETGYLDVTSPWGYNGPFFSHECDESIQKRFWSEVDLWYEQHQVVSEFLRFNFYGNHKSYSGKAVHTLLNVKGRISDWDLFWGNLKSNTRNQYRKAEKNGLQFEIHFNDISEDKVAQFYEVYIGTMDRRDAIDSFYHPLDYFVDVCRHNSGKCAIGLVLFEGKPISSEFFLISSDTMFSFLGGTHSDYFKLRPNEYLKINAVRWAKQTGLDYYMIGGGLSKGTDDKLYQYKKKYFPFDDDIDFYTGRKIILPEIYKDFSLNRRELEVSENSLFEITEGFFPKYRESVK